jgi:hypothetical protein
VEANGSDDREPCWDVIVSSAKMAKLCQGPHGVEGSVRRSSTARLSPRKDLLMVRGQVAAPPAGFLTLVSESASQGRVLWYVLFSLIPAGQAALLRWREGRSSSPNPIDPHPIDNHHMSLGSDEKSSWTQIRSF